MDYLGLPEVVNEFKYSSILLNEMNTEIYGKKSDDKKTLHKSFHSIVRGPMRKRFRENAIESSFVNKSMKLMSI